jgi:hypothetical protein
LRRKGLADSFHCARKRRSQTHVARPVRSYSVMACITACSKSRCNSGIEVWTIRIATIFSRVDPNCLSAAPTEAAVGKRRTA